MRAMEYAAVPYEPLRAGSVGCEASYISRSLVARAKGGSFIGEEE